MRKILKISLVVLAVLLLAGCTSTKEKFKLELANLDKISEISIENQLDHSEASFLTEREDIEKIYNILNGKETDVKAADEIPTDKDKLLRVIVKSEEPGDKVLYLYFENNSYFVEEVKGGIYSLTEDEYNQFTEVKEDNDYQYRLLNFALDDLEKIVVDNLGMNDHQRVITDPEKMEEIQKIFHNKYSKTPSEDYNPENPDILFHVTFIAKNKSEISLYIYKRGEKYFIEESLVAIYSCTKEDFETVQNLFN